MTHRFNVCDVDSGLMAKLAKQEATSYYHAMTFQLGCAIGELIAMGVPPEVLAENIDVLIEKAILTRLSVDTKELKNVE